MSEISLEELQEWISLLKLKRYETLCDELSLNILTAEQIKKNYLDNRYPDPQHKFINWDVVLGYICQNNKRR